MQIPADSFTSDYNDDSQERKKKDFEFDTQLHTKKHANCDLQRSYNNVVVNPISGCVHTA